jgi:hypothetical protein
MLRGQNLPAHDDFMIANHSWTLCLFTHIYRPWGQILSAHVYFCFTNLFQIQKGVATENRHSHNWKLGANAKPRVFANDKTLLIKPDAGIAY